MNWRDHIDRDPAVLGGKPKIHGTRLSVELILGRLGEGWTANQLREAYPHLTDEHIQACLAYAADALAADEVIDVPLSAAQVTMRLLADENIDRPIIRWLIEQGHDVIEVRVDAPTASDEHVIALSRRTDRVLLTFDRDIGRLLQADSRPHPGVVYLRLVGVAGELWDRFKALWPSIQPLAPGRFVTVQNTRIRYRPLPMDNA